MKVMGNYDVNCVVQVSSSTEVYIAVNYHSLQSFIPWETQWFGPVPEAMCAHLGEMQDVTNAIDSGAPFHHNTLN